MKKVIVTGSSQGIGKACCQLLIDKDYLVLGLDYKLSDSQLSLKKNYRHVLMNITSPEFMNLWMETLKQEKPDFIIHCAGMGALGRFNELSIEQELLMIDLNVKGTYEIVKGAVLSHDEKLPLHVIVFGSTAGFSATPSMSTYAGTKHFISGFVTSLRAELHLSKSIIKLSSMAPPPVRTNFRENMGLADRSVSIRGVLQPMDVAKDVYHVMFHPQTNRVTGFLNRLIFNYIQYLIPAFIRNRITYNAGLKV
jgi:short-subunit dehydrogenase